jgi:hypothetical protein
MGFNRWMWFFVVVALLLAAALTTRFWPQPIPEISCNEPLFDAKVAESVAVGQWAHRNVLHLAGIGLLFTVALFYFQVFHWLTARFAPIVSTLLALVVAWGATVLTDYWWIQQVQRWAERQRPSCLEEALADSASASYAAWSGELFRRLPSFDAPHWASLLMADAVALTTIAVLAGWLMYLLARRAIQF